MVIVQEGRVLGENGARLRIGYMLFQRNHTIPFGEQEQFFVRLARRGDDRDGAAGRLGEQEQFVECLHQVFVRVAVVRFTLERLHQTLGNVDEHLLGRHENQRANCGTADHDEL